MAWSKEAPYTYDHTKVGSTDSANFTALVDITDNNLKQTGGGGLVTNVNGYDIAFFSDSALTTLLSWNVESYDGTTGRIRAWVLIPSLSHTSDGVIYISAGNASVTTFQGGSAGAAYDTYTAAVWHLPDGTTLSLADSSVNANNGTNHSATATTGEIDGGVAFDGSSQWCDMGTGSSLDLTGDFTFSLWVNPASVSSTAQFWIANDKNTGTRKFALGQISTGGFQRIYFEYGGSIGSSGNTNIDLTTGGWQYVAVVGNISTLTSYRNGVTGNTPATGGFLASSTNPTTLGRRDYSGFNYWYPGSLDEVKMSAVARSADWLLAEYNNQSSPATFWTLGSWVTPPSAGTKTSSLIF